MHFQKKYGYTVSEIENDNLAPVVPIPCYTEEQREKSIIVFQNSAKCQGIYNLKRIAVIVISLFRRF